MINQTKNYLMIIKIGGDTPKNDIPRIAIRLRDAIDKLSNNQNKSFLISSTGDVLGFFLRTNKYPHTLREALYGNTNIIETSILDNSDDSVFISEITENWTALGFSNGWAWLQRHMSSS